MIGSKTTDFLNFSITCLLFSSAHTYSIGGKLDCKVANSERKNGVSWRGNDKQRAAWHYLCIDWKLIWFSWLKPTDLLSASPGGGQGSPLDWGGVQAKIRNAWSWPIVGNVFGDYHALCTLKTSFVDFKTEEVHCSRYNEPTLHAFSMAFKSSWLINYLIYIVFIYYWTCFLPQL